MSDHVQTLVMPESQMDHNYAICPYCENKVGDCWEWVDEDPQEYECDKCGKTYRVWASRSVMYHTEPIEINDLSRRGCTDFVSKYPDAEPRCSSCENIREECQSGFDVVTGPKQDEEDKLRDAFSVIPEYEDPCGFGHE